MSHHVLTLQIHGLIHRQDWQGTSVCYFMTSGKSQSGDDLGCLNSMKTPMTAVQELESTLISQCLEPMPP